MIFLFFRVVCSSSYTPLHHFLAVPLSSFLSPPLSLPRPIKIVDHYGYTMGALSEHCLALAAPARDESDVGHEEMDIVRYSRSG